MRPDELVDPLGSQLVGVAPKPCTAKPFIEIAYIQRTLATLPRRAGGSYGVPRGPGPPRAGPSAPPHIPGLMVTCSGSVFWARPAVYGYPLGPYTRLMAPAHAGVRPGCLPTRGCNMPGTRLSELSEPYCCGGHCGLDCKSPWVNISVVKSPAFDHHRPLRPPPALPTTGARGSPGRGATGEPGAGVLEGVGDGGDGGPGPKLESGTAARRIPGRGRRGSPGRKHGGARDGDHGVARDEGPRGARGGKPRGSPGGRAAGDPATGSDGGARDGGHGKPKLCC